VAVGVVMGGMAGLVSGEGANGTGSPDPLPQPRMSNTPLDD
jgi:hypothetical protein